MSMHTTYKNFIHIVTRRNICFLCFMLEGGRDERSSFKCYPPLACVFVLRWARKNCCAAEPSKTIRFVCGSKVFLWEFGELTSDWNISCPSLSEWILVFPLEPGLSAAQRLVVCIREIILGLSEAKFLAEVIRPEMGLGEEKGNPSTF